MKVIYSRSAVDDLQRLRRFIARHNAKAAHTTANRLINAVVRLTEFPLMGKKVTRHNKDILLRDLVTGKYVIRYAIIGKELHVLRIWHGKENLF